MGILNKHAKLEKNVTLLAICAFFVVTIGGLVQIVPLFYLENTIEDVEGMRPYTPLELAGREPSVEPGALVRLAAVPHAQLAGLRVPLVGEPRRAEVDGYRLKRG